MGYFPDGILSPGILSSWDFFLCDFFLMGFFPTWDFIRIPWRRAAVITDSRSLVDALEGDGSHRRLDRLRQLLRECGEDERELTVLWVPGHCGLQGNEMADEEARRGAEMPQQDVPMDRSSRSVGEK